jgi:hypothetical protein
MFCTECGGKLPQSAKFCPSCGTPTASAAVDRGTRSSPSVDSDITPGDVVNQLLDERKRIAELAENGDLAKYGPMTETDVKDGARLHEHLAKISVDLSEEHRRTVLEPLQACRDAVMFLAVGKQLWIDGPDARRRVRNDFKLYADHGVIALAEANKQYLRGHVDRDFLSNLQEYRGIRQYLDATLFPFLLTGLKINNCLPVKKHQIEQIADRIGIKKASEGMKLVLDYS